MSGKNIVSLLGLVSLVVVLIVVYWYTTTQSLIPDEVVEVPLDSDAAFYEQLERDGYTPPTGPPPPLDPPSAGDTVPPATPPPTVRERLAAIMIEIEANTSLEASAVSECRLLPLGNAPCGGPAFYHVYAETGSNVPVLQQLSADHQALATELNRAEEIMGICVVTPEPSIELVAGNCTTILE